MPKGKVIDRDEVKVLAEEGKGTTEIAKIIGCDRRTVSRIRNELGIPAEEGSTVEKWIDEHVKVKAWVAKLKERHGRLQYAGALRRYCDIRDKAPDELLEEAWEDTQQRKPHERKLPDIMLIYKSNREEEGKSPNTIAYELSAIRSFYKKNGYDIIERKELIERPRPREENGKEVIYPDKMRELASIMIPMDKAMYLSAYQSGLSQKELLGLKMRDIKRIEDGIIRLPERTRAKTGIRFRTFIGNDARESIEAWLQKRNSGNLLPKNLQASRDAVVKSDDDAYLFIGYDKRHGRWGRVSPTTFAKRMRDYCRQLGWLKIEDGEFKENGLRSRYRPHALRMSFSTVLKSKNVPALHVEHMLGHAAAYNGAYDVVNEADLFETYKRAEKYLSIRPEPSKELESIEALRKELEAKSGKISELEEKMATLEAREAEKEPYEAITTELRNDPEMRDMIKKWLEKKAR
jgi:integrase